MHRRLLTPLISADQLRYCANVAPHDQFEISLRGMSEVRECDVESIQLEKVSMASDGRTGPAVPGRFPIVEALERPRRERFGRRSLRQAVGLCGNVVENPMHPGHFRRTRIRSVW